MTNTYLKVSLYVIGIILIVLLVHFVSKGQGTFPAGAPHPSSEITSLRDQYSKHFCMPEGSRQALICNGPVHYRDQRGRWQDIDTRPVASKDPSYAWENTSNTFQSYYPASLAADKGIKVSNGGHSLTVSMAPHLEAFDASGRPIMFLEQACPAPATTHLNKVVYKGAFTTGNHEFEVKRGALKNNLVLMNLPANLPPDAAFLGLCETIQIPPSWSLKVKDVHLAEATNINRPIDIVDERGNVHYHIPLPEIYELNSPVVALYPNEQWRNVFRVVNKGQGIYELCTLVPVSWLTEPGRSWPVVIDPTITTPGGWGGSLYNGSLNEYNPTFNVFAASNYFGSEYRGYIQWDISSIPDTATIYDTEVRLYLNATNNNFAVDSIPINAVTLGTAPFFVYTDSIWDDLGDEPYTVFPCSLSLTNYGYFDLGPAADTHLFNRLPVDAFPIGISMSPGSTAYKRFTSDLSMLRITYQLCSGGQVSATLNGTDLGCYNDSSGSISATASGGGSSYTYVWSGPDGYLDTIQNPTALPAGTYTVTVYSGSVCPYVGSITLFQPDSAYLVFDSVSHYGGGHNVSCFEASDGFLSVVSSDGGSYAYDWTGPNGFTLTGQNLAGIGAGTYIVTATSGAGCTLVDSLTLSAPEPLDVFIQNHTDAWCPYDSNGSATAAVTGGTPPYTRLWNTGATNLSLTALHANTSYFLTVTDLNGCTDTASVFIEAQYELPPVELGPDTGFCEGGSILLNAGTGSSWIWNNGLSGQVQVVNTLDTYAVTVTSMAGCVKADTIVIDTIYPLPSPDLGPDINIEATTVTLDAGNYAAYLWNTGATTRQITVAVDGVYTVTVTDVYGCKNSDETEVSFLLGVPLENREGFSVHPNPVKDVLVVTASSVTDPELEVLVLDALAKVVIRHRVKTATPFYMELVTEELPEGYYFLHVSGVNTGWQCRFIVEK